jgi:hypothetical protein
MQTGAFTNAQATYFGAPQQLNNAGQIIGHNHVVVEKIDSIDSTQPTSPRVFAFFKGLNAAAQGGQLTADVTNGLDTGTYRLCSITSSANHQGVVVPVAQRGSVDDCVYVSSFPIVPLVYLLTSSREFSLPPVAETVETTAAITTRTTVTITTVKTMKPTVKTLQTVETTVKTLPTAETTVKTLQTAETTAVTMGEVAETVGATAGVMRGAFSDGTNLLEMGPARHSPLAVFFSDRFFIL